MNPPVVLVTGAARGLGRAIALAFADQKFAVALHYHTSESAVQETKTLVEKRDVQVQLIRADLRDSKQVNAMVQTVSEKWGRLDVLINNAGAVSNRTIAKMTDEAWRDVMAINLDAPFYATRTVIPVMRKQKGGSIVNITSYIATKGAHGAANYAAAKAGLITLTKNTAIEEGAHHIRANAVMPGFHVTDMNHEVWGKFEKSIRDQHVLPKMPDRDELGRFVFYVSQLTSVSGQVFSFESRLS